MPSISSALSACEDLLSDPIQAIEDTFNESVSIEELNEMTAEEKTALFEKLYEGSGITEAKYNEFMDSLEQEIKEKRDEIRSAGRDLNDILDQDNIKPLDKVKTERVKEELNELRDDLDFGELSNLWGDAVGEYQERHVDVTDGSAYEHDEAVLKPESGDNYVIDARTGETDSGRSDLDPHPDWIDTDGDGYGDLEQVLDAQGRPTVDRDNNKVLDERDRLDYEAPKAPQTIKLKLEEGTDIAVESYDEETGELVLKCMKEDGTIYNTTILGVTADCNLNLVLSGTNGGLTDIGTFADWPKNVLRRFFESTNTQGTGMSLYNVIHGDEQDSGTPGDYFSIYNMVNHGSTTGLNELSVPVPTDQDFRQGREYTINFAHRSADTLTINLPAEPKVVRTTFTTEGNNLVLHATTDEGEIRYILSGIEISADTRFCDRIVINNGTMAWSQELVNLLQAFEVPVVTGGTGVAPTSTEDTFSVFALIYHNGIGISQEATTNGFPPDELISVTPDDSGLPGSDSGAIVDGTAVMDRADVVDHDGDGSMDPEDGVVGDADGVADANDAVIPLRVFSLSDEYFTDPTTTTTRVSRVSFDPMGGEQILSIEGIPDNATASFEKSAGGNIVIVLTLPDGRTTKIELINMVWDENAQCSVAINNPTVTLADEFENKYKYSTNLLAGWTSLKADFGEENARTIIGHVYLGPIQGWNNVDSVLCPMTVVDD
ncbi:MAG: hypothetical protein HQM16_13960 [Deltaproteobacteria bacterium]|nr:hypothetical protein [Deltaproteobacteria bacterium]